MIEKIEFRNVLPNPLRDSPLGGIVWQQDIDFSKTKNYLVKADSGKGKSTLLNIIYGTRKDYSGSISFDGKPISQMDSNTFSEFRETKIAYLFQDLRLFGQLTPAQNVLLKPGCAFGESEIQNYAAILGITDQLHKPCSKLSLGQQQRVALLRALSHPFEWLLLDEPFSHLDRKNSGIAMSLIMEFAKRSKAGIIATSLGDETGFENFEVVEL
jgi:putative ABC transport system ATP-binding protein